MGNLLTEEFAEVEGDGGGPKGVVNGGGVGGLVEMPSEVTTDTVIDTKTGSGRNLGDDQQKNSRKWRQEHRFRYRRRRNHTKFLAGPGPEFKIDR